MYNPPADGLDLTMKGTLNLMFDYCSIRSNTKHNYYKTEPIILALFQINLNRLTYFFFSRSSCEWPHPPKLEKLLDNGILLICYNLIGVWVYAISAAMLMFGLDNEEQHIFTFCAFINQKFDLIWFISVNSTCKHDYKNNQGHHTGHQG